MTLLSDLTPRELRDLAIRMTIMEPGDLIKLVMEHPARVNAVALMAATAAWLAEPDEPGS